MAAGVLLIHEAGGVCTDMRGGPMDLHGPHVLGDNGLVHEETVALFAEIFAGKYRHSLPELPEPADS
jgi:3'-phosphoadenosine 5'-phosphosulfate (PAPS) 3'-phosphatase